VRPRGFNHTTRLGSVADISSPQFILPCLGTRAGSFPLSHLVPSTPVHRTSARRARNKEHRTSDTSEGEPEGCAFSRGYRVSKSRRGEMGCNSGISSVPAVLRFFDVGVVGRKRKEPMSRSGHFASFIECPWPPMGMIQILAGRALRDYAAGK